MKTIIGGLFKNRHLYWNSPKYLSIELTFGYGKKMIATSTDSVLFNAFIK